MRSWLKSLKALIAENSTATGNSGTINKMAGKLTSAALTTAAGSEQALTVTNSQVAAADHVFVSIANGTNSAGVPMITRVTPAAGSFVATLRNIHASAAFNGTIVLSFFVVKAA